MQSCDWTLPGDQSGHVCDVEMSEHTSRNTSSCVDLESTLPVVTKAIWIVLKKRDFPNFGRVLDFLELTHEQVPGLLCYRHHAKLSIGLRGKMVLHMIEEKKPLLEILKALDYHFPPVFSDDSTASRRDLCRLRQAKIHFRKLVLRMIRDEKFRQHYVAVRCIMVAFRQPAKDRYEVKWEEDLGVELEVPETSELPVVEDRNLTSPRIRPNAGPNISTVPGVCTEERTVMKPNGEHLSPAIETWSAEQEEPPDVLPAQRGKRQNSTDSAQDSGSRDGSGNCEQIVLQTGGSEERALTREVEDPVCSHSGEQIADCNSEHQALYFDIFGFDCSESSKLNNFRNLSPPDPLQSQERDHALGLDLNSQSLYEELGDRSTESLGETQSREGIEEVPSESPVPVSVHQVTLCPVSGTETKEQTAGGEPLLEGLISWRYQPQVLLTPLPVNVVSRYVCQGRAEVESGEDDVTPQAADSELSRGTTLPDLGSFTWGTSVPTDNDSGDLDYNPGRNFFCHVGHPKSSIQTRRVLRSSSLS
ncbi:TERF1-interacting nuclear factor 2 [Mixophyes fleayi]|uniref:TERF1-interacting nuclear factor 2 n=1 Tax=Mixophyes fleayi TaxID=3061075 RepID=UPI003F4DF7A5